MNLRDVKYYLEMLLNNAHIFQPEIRTAIKEALEVVEYVDTGEELTRWRKNRNELT